mgnify:CR=1 FL=1
MVIRGNASELDELYKVRENYFDKGMPLDTIFLKKCIPYSGGMLVFFATFGSHLRNFLKVEKKIMERFLIRNHVLKFDNLH